MLNESGQVIEPLVLINLDEPPASVPSAGGRLRVGVATRPLTRAALPLLGDLDVTVAPAGISVPREAVAVADPRGRARELGEACARSPQAALVLGQVLRASAGLPVPAAVDVESFAYSMLLGGAEFGWWRAGQGGRALPPTVEDPVLVDRDAQDVLRVTLNRPQRRNAYGRQLRDALADALRVAVLDPSVDRVVLDGAGPCFCSGGDLAEFGTTPDLVTAHFVRTLAGAGLLAHALRERLEVHVHGPCVGAGVELPAFAGRVIAAAGTTFSLPEVAMGLIPGAGGTVSIPRRVGRWRALYLALSGRPLDAATALAWGLIDEIAELRPRVGTAGAAQRASHVPGDAAVDADDRAGGEARGGAGQVHHDRRRLLRAAQAAQRQVGHVLALPRRPPLADVGAERPRQDRVDPDLRAVGVGQADRQQVQARLRAGVRQLVDARHGRAGGADVDDGAAVVVGHPGGRQRPQAERPLEVDGEGLVVQLFGDLVDRGVQRRHARVVHQDVQPAHPLDGLLDQRAAVVPPTDVAGDRRGLDAGLDAGARPGSARRPPRTRRACARRSRRRRRPPPAPVRSPGRCHGTRR